MNAIEQALLWATWRVVKKAASVPVSTRATPLRVLMVGYSGKRNAGAEVRTAEIIRQLRSGTSRLKDAEFSVLSLNPVASRPYYPDDVRLVPLATVYFADLLRACSEHDVGLLCEGSCLKSVTSNAAALFYIAAAGIFAAQNKPCVGVGVEAGRMEPEVERAARKLCKDTLFLARSDASLKMFGELGLRARRGTDAAWSVVPAADSWAQAELLRLGRGSAERALVGVGLINPFNRPIQPSVTKLLATTLSGDHRQRYNALYYYSDSPERQRKYAAYIAAAAAERPLLDGHEQVVPVLIEMEPNDARCVADLERALGRTCIRISSKDYDGEQMTALLRCLSLLVTSRYHAHVLSMPAGVPCVAISKDERLTAIFAENGLSSLCVASDDPELATQLAGLVEKAWQTRTTLSPLLRRLSEKYLRQQLEMTAAIDAELDAHVATRPGASPLALSPSREGTDGIATYFCDSYEGARKQFLGTLEQRKDERPPFEWTVRSVGNPSEHLHTDFVHFPARGRPGRLLTFVTGTHGIEGYVGSMVLQVLVNELDLSRLPSDVGLLLVHAVNPHGFRYGRRVNEHNVDLNRAFLRSFPAPAAADGFALRPTASALFKLLRRPSAELERAIVRGQRRDPLALFYGGQERQPEVRNFCEEYERIVGRYRSALLVDIHTGYGPPATQNFGARLSPEDAAAWSRTLGLPLQCVGQAAPSLTSGAKALDGYQADGGLLGYANDLHRRLGIGEESLALFWEFGTLGDSKLRKLQSLAVLLAESRRSQGKKRKIRHRPFDKDMASLFYPPEREWRSNAYLGAKIVLSRLLTNQQLGSAGESNERESYAHAV